MSRIAAVEDDGLMQLALREMVTRAGHEFALYSDGASALKGVASDRPDLILLDVHLPDLSGHEICRKLKADDATRRIPVIILTGEAKDLASRVGGLELGADDYLFKPISPKVLMARVTQLLNLSSGRRSA